MQGGSDVAVGKFGAHAWDAKRLTVQNDNEINI